MRACVFLFAIEAPFSKNTDNSRDNNNSDRAGERKSFRRTTRQNCKDVDAEQVGAAGAVGG